MDIIKKNTKKTNSNSYSQKKEFYFQFEKNLNQKNTSKKEIFQKDNKNKEKRNKSQKKLLRFFLKSILSLLILFIIGSIYFGWKIFSVSQKINLDKNSTTIVNDIKSAVSPLSATFSKNYTPLKGEENGRINILLLGSSGEDNPGRNLTDTIMVMSIDIETKKIGLLSIPRDLYVEIPDTNQSAKINSIYKYGLIHNKGIDPIKKTVSKVTGIPIHYYLAIDYEGFKSVIDTIDGIKVQVKRDIYDPLYPGPNYSYETFEIKKGVHLMDGETALKYARERHDDPDGDFGRAKRQQQVIQATKNKIFSLETFLNVFTLNKLLNTLEKNIKTNVEFNEIERFIKLSKEVDFQNINNFVLDAWEKDSLLRVSHVYYENGRAFILVPRIGNYSEIHDLAENIFDLKRLQRRKQEIIQENPSIAIFNMTQNSNLLYEVSQFLQEDLGFKKITILKMDENTLSAETKIYDLTEKEKPFSLDEIIKKVPATLSENPPIDIIKNIEKNNYDLMLTLGKDIKDIYIYEKISQEEFKKANKERQ